MGGGFGGAAGGEEVVNEEDTAAGFDGVGVDGDGIGAVFEVVALLEGGVGELALLSDGDEAGLELDGGGGGEDEAARIDADDGIDSAGLVVAGEEVNAEGEEGGVGQDGGNVFELNARFRKSGMLRMAAWRSWMVFLSIFIIVVELSGYWRGGKSKIVSKTKSWHDRIIIGPLTWKRSAAPSQAQLRLFLDSFDFFDHFAEFVKGDVLDLADALAGDAKFFANFLEGLFGAAVEAEAVTEDGGLARIEVLDHLLQHFGDGLFLELLVRGVGIFVLNDFGEVIGFVIADGGVEGGGADGGGAHLADAAAEMPSSSASSSSVGSRPNSSWSFMAVRRILEILSTRWTGSRMVLDWLAKARLMDCLIHQEP